MNQILYIENNKHGDFRKTAKISAIVLFVFAILLIGKGVYGFVSSAQERKITDPNVAIREIEGKMELNITHDKVIDNITYSWNNSDEKTLQGKGQTEIKEIIDIPGGSNVLTLKITDVEKHTANYTKAYYKDDSIDYEKPEIEIDTKDPPNLKIIATDNKKIVSLTYYWNSEDATVKQPEENKNKIEVTIPIKQGENVLTVIAEDEAGNVETTTKTCQAYRKPSIEITQDNDEAVIRVKDEVKIVKIELTLNGEMFSTDPNNEGVEIGMQEVEFRQKLIDGENTLKVTAYGEKLERTEEKILKVGN